MFKTIVVPLDGTTFAEHALVPARALAARVDADLALVVDGAAALITTSPERYLTDVASRNDVTNAELVVTDQGDLPATLEELVANVPDPLIVMATHAPVGVSRVLIGSLAEEVVRRVAAPVIFVGPSVDLMRAIGSGPMLVCTDGSPAADWVVPVAAQWIAALGVQSYAIEVIDPDADPIPTELGNDVLESGAAHALARRLSPASSWDVLHGADAADAIVEHARRLPASLIAMSTRGLSGLSRLVLGSTTASVAHRAPCPVLVVNAPDPDAKTRQ